MVKRIIVIAIIIILLLLGCGMYEKKTASNNIEPQIIFYEHAGYQNPEVILDGWMMVYLWGEIKNAYMYSNAEIKEYVENHFYMMQLSTSEGEFDIKKSILNVEDKDSEIYDFTYVVFIDSFEKPFDVRAVKYLDKNDNKLKIGNCGNLRVHPRYYCEPKIAFCYEAPIKALNNNVKEYCLTYYICLPTLREDEVKFWVKNECCSVKSYDEDFDVEKEIITLYENDKSKDELNGLRAYRVELSVNVEENNMVLDPIIQIEINDNEYSCMTHPIILNSVD